MNRVAVGPKGTGDGGVKVDVVHLDNLVGARSEIRLVFRCFGVSPQQTTSDGSI